MNFCGSQNGLPLWKLKTPNTWSPNLCFSMSIRTWPVFGSQMPVSQTWGQGLVPRRSWQLFGMTLAGWPPLSLPPFRIQISSFQGFWWGFQCIIFLLLQLEYVYLFAVMNTEWQMQWCASLIAGWYRPSFVYWEVLGFFLHQTELVTVNLEKDTKLALWNEKVWEPMQYVNLFIYYFHIHVILYIPLHSK